MANIFSTKTCHPELVSGSDLSAQGARCRNKFGMTQWAGFTLAEVLVTLGIIGVVAALTMPVLTAAYQKKVMVTRLQKFYSVFKQAANMKIAEDGALDTSMINVARSPDQMMEFFNTNYAPYLRTLSVKKLERGIVAALPDGSGFYMANCVGDNNGDKGIRPYFCVNYKDCDNIDEVNAAACNNMHLVEKPGGIFHFYYSGDFPSANLGSIPQERYTLENVANRCKGTVAPANGNNCAGWIQRNGWQIPEDYPW